MTNEISAEEFVYLDQFQSLFLLGSFFSIIVISLSFVSALGIMFKIHKYVYKLRYYHGYDDSDMAMVCLKSARAL